MQKLHFKKTFPWWLGLPGILIVLLTAFGFVQSHPFWTLLIIAVSIGAYLVLLRRLSRAPRGEDPDE